MNAIFIRYFHEHSGTFKTFLWIYWLQSVTMGVFNFFYLLTLKDPIPETTSSTSNTKSTFKSNGCLAFFFLIHYGGFHFIYGIFLLTDFNHTGTFDWKLFKYAALYILINQLIWFIQHKLKHRNQSPGIGRLFFIPYLRIIPMHLIIILPAFFHIGSITLFLLLKTFIDVIFHLITTEWYWKKERTIVGDIAKTDLIWYARAYRLLLYLYKTKSPLLIVVATQTKGALLLTQWLFDRYN